MTKVKLQPAIYDTTKWTMADLAQIVDDLAMGEFETLGQLVYWLGKDARIGSTINTRGASVLQDASIHVISEDDSLATQLRQDMALCLPPTTINQLLTNLKLAGVAPVQVLYREGAPLLQSWSIQHFRQDQESWQWKVRTRQKNLEIKEEPITFGEKWLFLGTEIEDRPWFNISSGWQVLAPLRIGGVSSLVWWLRAAMHNSISPIQVKTEGAPTEVKKDFFDQLDKLGQILYIEMPYGVNLERVKSEPLDFEGTKEVKQEIDKLITEYMLGQSTTTRLDTGSYNAVEVLVDEISTPLISLELTVLAYALNEKWIPLWKKWRGVEESVPIAIEWQVQPFKDVQRWATAMRDIAVAVEKWPALEEKARELLKI